MLFNCELQNIPPFVGAILHRACFTTTRLCLWVAESIRAYRIGSVIQLGASKHIPFVGAILYRAYLRRHGFAFWSRNQSAPTGLVVLFNCELQNIPPFCRRDFTSRLFYDNTVLPFGSRNQSAAYRIGSVIQLGASKHTLL